MGELRRSMGRLSAPVMATVGAALLLAAPSFASGAASTFTVSGFADGTGSCASAPDANGNVACTTLRAAVSRANLQSNQPTILLQAGTYQLDAASGGQLAMGAFTIQGAGPGGPAGTTIEQTDGKDRVIEVQAGPAKLIGLEVTGGHLAPGWTSGTTWRGGGILAEGPLVLQNALVTGNQVVAPAGPSLGDAGDAAEGGGIDYYTGTLAGSAISDSTITDNVAAAGAGGPGGDTGGAAEGGGIAYEGDGALRIDASTISQNAAAGGAGGDGAGHGGTGGVGEGGGIFNTSDVTVTATTLASNRAAGGAQGGGPPSPPFSGGAGDGGAVFNQGALDQLVNTTVFSNAGQGGAAVLGGTGGVASGGGLFDQGSSSGVVLQSDTFDGNQASNLVVNTPLTFTVRDTIVAAGSPNNCQLTAPPSSQAYNLEDDAAGQCGFGAANHDLVGANPQLSSSLAENGGTTQTLAPTPTSPVLRAGGQCMDPTSSPPGQPLATDQRGLPRSVPCDIGAFEGQAPHNTSRPVLGGVTARGHTLTCALGVWTGDGPFAFAYEWLRDGISIAGAPGQRYLVRAVDAGHTLACGVTATHYGSTTATSPLASVIPNPVVTLLRVRVTGTTAVVSLGCRGETGQRCSGVLKLAVREKLHGTKVVALLAPAKKSGRRTSVGLRAYGIAARSVKTLRLGLDKTGLGLLRSFGRIHVLFILAQGPQTVASRKLTFPGRPARRS